MPPRIRKPHGRSGYVKRGCRCEICVRDKQDYNRLYMRRWRERKRSIAMMQQFRYPGSLKHPGSKQATS
jgi:hypothetical protein